MCIAPLTERDVPQDSNLMFLVFLHLDHVKGAYNPCPCYTVMERICHYIVILVTFQMTVRTWLLYFYCWTLPVKTRATFTCSHKNEFLPVSQCGY